MQTKLAPSCVLVFSCTENYIRWLKYY